MSFWDLNDGTKAESKNTFELASGNLEPIPNDTTCIAAIEENQRRHKGGTKEAQRRRTNY